MAGLHTDALLDRKSYRLLLKDFSDSLSTRDLRMIKFICTDLIPPSELEKVNSGCHAWRSLEEKGIMTQENYMLLADMFYLIGRIDLLKQLAVDPVKAEIRIVTGTTYLSSFRVLLCKLGVEIPPSKLEDLKYIYHQKLPTQALEDAADIWSLFLLLERQDLLASDNIDCLHDMINVLGKPALLTLIQQYTDSMNAKMTFYPYEEYGWQPGCEGLIDELPAYPGLVSQPPSYNRIEHFIIEANENLLPYQNPVTNDQDQAYLWEEAKQKATQPSRIAHQETPPSAAHSKNEVHPSATAKQHRNATKSSVKQTAEMNDVRSQQYLPERFDMVLLSDIAERMPQLPLASRHVEDLKQYPVKTGRPVTEQITELTEAMANINTGSETSLLELPSYKMDSVPRGPCIIINNQMFYHVAGDKKSRKLENRVGSSVDEASLKNLFDSLGFRVSVYNDCTVRRMKEIFRATAAAQERLKESDALVVIILSHGKYGMVYGADGYEFKIVSILQYFKSERCPALIKKPKLFFLQACQGKEKQTVTSKIHTDELKEVEDELMPQDADFFIGYATLPGYVSYRHEDQGSWYISTLVEHLKRYAHKHDLLSIMTEVNRFVAKRSVIDSGQTYKQLPLPYTTLTKKVYLKPVKPFHTA